MIERKLLRRLLESLSYFPIVGLIGARQVGKTTLAKALGAYLPKPVLYLDLENFADAAKLADAQGYLSQHFDKCVILDEVQQRPDLFALLRSLCDQKREPARYILLGSASPYLIRDLTETLAGRIAYHELTPFSLTEIQHLYPMREHWFRGGFPGALLAPTSSLSRKWLLDFVETFVTRDVKRLSGAVPETKIHNLIRMVAHLHGSLLNMSQLSNSLDISQPTVGRYLDLLEGSFLVRRLPPFFENTGKRLVKSPKIYLRDTGLLHRLIGVADAEALAGHPQLGASWEGYVIEQIIREADEGGQFYFYRTSHGAEADLVWITDHNKRICIEIKYSVAPSISRGFQESARDLRPDFRYVIIPEGESYSRSDGIRVCSLPDFLKVEMPVLQSR
ncbi:MAG: ATP-binding protein [Saprospiraceae bacterium]|nr:ATP-binding protein [Saprospiraceae bacterium]MDW8229453.1 ATP-binding protein [Saprospiraceae bacterium]